MGAAPWWAWGWLRLDMVFIARLDVVDTGCAGCSLWSWHYCMYVPAHMHMCVCIYSIVSSEISVYLKKIKVVSITSELILYYFTSD